MRMRSILVSGFKNIKKSRLELENICAVVSPNNYGKSNLIEAIGFGFDFIHESRKGRKTMMNWAKAIPLCSALENEEFQFEVELEDETLGEYQYVRYGFSFRWYRDDGSGEVITDEWLEARENTSVRYSGFLKRKEGKYRKGKSTNAYRKIELDELQLAIDVLNLKEDIELVPLVKCIQEISFRVCSSLDLRDRYQPSPLEYIGDNEDSVRFDDEDVPRALSLLKKNNPEMYGLFEDSVYSLFPEFTSISLNEYTIADQKQPDKVVTLRVAEQKDESEKVEKEIPFKIREHIYRLFIKSEYLNQPLSIANMSTGTKRIIWLLVNAFISNLASAGIVGVEEIETSIHPRMMRQLLEALSEALGNSSLLVSSHSPYLIQYLKPEKIYIGLPNKDGVAEFRRISKGKVKLLLSKAREMEISVGEYIFEMLSGDLDDYQILESFLEVSEK